MSWKVLIQLDCYKAKNLSGIFNDVDVAQFMLDCFKLEQDTAHKLWVEDYHLKWNGILEKERI